MRPVAPVSTTALAPAAAGPAARPERRVADVLADAIARADGAPFAFGVPGGEVLTLIDGLRGAGIAFHAARHEGSAGFMAEGGHRVAGGPAVLVATLGPGVANATNVTANALQDGVPLLVLGGRVGTDVDPGYTHQILDQIGLFAPITKATFTMSVERASEIASSAVATALTEPRGPVYVDCPSDVMAALASPVERRPKTMTLLGPADEGALDDIGDRLTGAARPLILAGLHALRDGVPESLTRLVVDHDIPILTTYKTKGLVDETLPGALGGLGLSPLADRTLLPFVARADVVLLAGYDPVETRPVWMSPFGHDATVIELTTVPCESAPATERLIVPDLAAALKSVADRHPGGARWTDGEPEEVQRELTEAFRPRAAWEPAVIFEAVREALPDDAILTVDTGAHRILMAQQWVARHPGRMIQSSGLCTMACAVPLAIGAKLARPASRVVAFVGDGGMEMGLGELATLRDLALSLTIVVLDDSSFQLIALKQRAMEYASTGVDLGSTDFAAVASAMGGTGVRVTSRDALMSAVQEAADRRGFTLIHAPLARGAYDGRI